MTVIGEITVQTSEAEENGPLSRANRRVLAAFVAAGPKGIRADSLANAIWSGPAPSHAALRMAVARLRSHFSPGALPNAIDGHYRLHIPVDEVDAWRLRHLALWGIDDAATTGELHRLLQSTAVFGDVDGGDLIESARAEIYRWQRTVLTRLADERPDQLEESFIPHLVGHLKTDPFNENLLALTAKTYHSAGDRRAAIELLASARHNFAKAGLDLSPSLSELESMLLGIGGYTATHRPAVPTQTPFPTQTTVPGPLREQLGGSFVGRHDDLTRLAALLDGLDGVAGVAITGPSGSGKTRLCAEFAKMATEHGATVLYSAAPQADTISLGSFYAVLPRLRQIGRKLIADGIKGPALRTAVWAAATDELERETAGRPLVVMFDECQWIDENSAALLAFLTRNRFAMRVIFIVSGRDDPTDPEDPTGATWPQLLDVFDQLGEHCHVPVGPLGFDDTRALFASLRPDLTPQMVYEVASDLHAASQGNAGVVHAVTASLAGGHLTIPDLRSLNPERLHQRAVESLSDEAQTVGQWAAVIGPFFDLETLVSIADLEERHVLRAVDELVRANVLVERSVVDFAFSHVLMQSAIEQTVLRRPIAKMHAAAAGYFAADLHRRARHQCAAVPFVDPAVAQQSLIDSARARAKLGLNRLATVDFDLADGLSADPLPAEVDALFARVLDLTGFTAAALRRRRAAFQRCIDNDDHATALVVATSGLPDAELIDGDADLVTMLEAIDAARLDAPAAHDLAIHLAHQSAIAGQLDAAAQHADRADALANTPSQQVRAAVAKRRVHSSTRTPQERLEILLAVDEAARLVATEVQVERLVLLSIDHYEAGDRPAAQSARAQMERFPEGTLPPVRYWHGLLFDAMLCTDEQDTAGAQQRRDEAFNYAIKHGISEGENARFAPEFNDLWLRGDHGSLIDLVESSTLTAIDSVLGQAASAAIRDAVGESERSLTLAESLARKVLATRVSQGPGALAVIASVLARSDSDELVGDVYDMLARRGQSALVVGAAVCCLGPIDRYLAQLSRNPRRVARHLAAARELADRAQIPLWQHLTGSGPGPSPASARSLDLRESSDNPVAT